MKRENKVLESFKSLNENRLRLAQEEAKKIEEQAASRESFKDNYYAIREMKARKEKTRSMLMEAARNDAFATVIKAIYITALEAETLSDDNLILAESMVDKWIEESGGASKILGKVGNKTYLLSRITQIVEDAAQDSVKEIEAPEEEEEKQPAKKQMKNDAVDAAKDFIKNSNKKDLKDFVNQVIDSIQNTAEDKGEEKAAEKAEKEEENKEEVPAEDKTENETPVEDKGEEKLEDAPTEENKNEEAPKEDDSEEEKESQEVEKDIESNSEELKDIEDDEETELKDIEDDSDDANDDPKDIELDVPSEDNEVKATDSENGTPDTDIEDEEDSEDIDDSDDDSLNVSFDDDDDSDDETEDMDDDLGEPLDDDGIDNDITVDGDTESNGKVFDDLDKEEDVQKAIDLIRSRVADAEETFIRNNAEDKKKIDELLTKISTNVKTVEDLSDKDSVKSEMALESARINKRKIDAIRENRPLTIFEKMTRNLTKNIIKNSEVTESYLTEAGKLDIDHVVESAKVMYGFLETVNTLKLESVNEKYIEKVLEDMN